MHFQDMPDSKRMYSLALYVMMLRYPFSALPYDDNSLLSLRLDFKSSSY